MAIYLTKNYSGWHTKIYENNEFIKTIIIKITKQSLFKYKNQMAQEGVNISHSEGTI